jgi:hypothetical protein
VQPPVARRRLVGDAKEACALYLRLHPTARISIIKDRLHEIQCNSYAMRARIDEGHVKPPEAGGEPPRRESLAGDHVDKTCRRDASASLGKAFSRALPSSNEPGAERSGKRPFSAKTVTCSARGAYATFSCHFSSACGDATHKRVRKVRT